MRLVIYVQPLGVLSASGAELTCIESQLSVCSGCVRSTDACVRVLLCKSVTCMCTHALV
jgi:hypothetical protein